jgi:hypothetical protein
MRQRIDCACTALSLRLEARARTARLRHNASVEDIDYHAASGLDRALFLKLGKL